MTETDIQNLIIGANIKYRRIERMKRNQFIMKAALVNLGMTEKEILEMLDRRGGYPEELVFDPEILVMREK